MFAVIFVSGSLEKPQKIRTRNNFVPHGKQCVHGGCTYLALVQNRLFFASSSFGTWFLVRFARILRRVLAYQVFTCCQTKQLQGNCAVL